jgi:hypothetical protein
MLLLRQKILKEGRYPNTFVAFCSNFELLGTNKAKFNPNYVLELHRED